MTPLPPCGLYKTTLALGSAVPAGKLVYFHNHGEPGPGIYLPSAWVMNRASFHGSGTVLSDPAWASSLSPLLSEGFYRVSAPFVCCEKRCRTFEAELLVQLGYDGNGTPLLFVPEWKANGFSIPERGSVVAPECLKSLVPVKVPGLAAGEERTVH
jgi:hypothetical protein